MRGKYNQIHLENSNHFFIFWGVLIIKTDFIFLKKGLSTLIEDDQWLGLKTRCPKASFLIGLPFRIFLLASIQNI